MYKALCDFSSKNALRFFMPGHNGGKALINYKIDLSHDLTELEETDNLHNPKGIICKAQKKAAKAFGAAHSRFLVNGSSCGVLAMISAFCREGERIVIDRGSHISAINALILTGCIPVWVYPERLEHCLSGGLNPEDVKSAIDERTSAVFITTPNYYGFCHDAAAIVRAAHEKGRPVLVDEAHGAHFAFSGKLPPTAMSCGADIAVQSAHKTLPALTQSALLHISHGVPHEKVDAYLRIYQSTSPSYLLMEYLDVAREIMEGEGRTLLERLIENISDIFPEKSYKSRFSPFRDLTRLIFSFDNITGFEAARIMKSEYGIIPEMADIYNIVCIANITHTRDDLLRLAAAVSDIRERRGRKADYGYSFSQSEAVVTPREAFLSEGRWVTLDEAIGKTAKNAVYLYPPGAVEIAPGEVITRENIENIKANLSLGGEVFGIKNSSYIMIMY